MKQTPCPACGCDAQIRLFDDSGEDRGHLACSDCNLPLSLRPRVGAAMELSRWVDSWLVPDGPGKIKSLFAREKRLARRALRGGKP